MNDIGVISLQKISKRFGETRAVDGLSLDLNESEFFALLGPSGCGKTTLLRMIAGFEHPDEGAILLDGKDIRAIPANKRPFNLMFQSYALFPHMNVRNNIAYGLEMEKCSRSEIASRVGEILEMTKLTEFATRKPHQLSGGQKQRVALARALVKRPRVLLLDEPLGALDKKLREDMQLELKRLQHELGITFVVVTHDQEEALVMADRVALMKDGRIAQLADPKTLYEHPANRFVAQFIGSTNLLEGTMSATGLDVAGLGSIIPPEHPGLEGRCGLSVRPERVFLSDERQVGDVNSLNGTIVEIAYRGQDRNLIVALADSPLSMIVRITADDTETQAAERGASVWCNWLPRHGRLLET